MRLIFIRHAEPDYARDSLTAKGFREAGLLSQRIKNWNVTAFYTSPKGRAKDTAAPTLKILNRTALECGWLREFTYPIDASLHPVGKSICWDMTPDYLDAHPILFNPDRWIEDPLMQSGQIDSIYRSVCQEFDALLASYGYVQKGFLYQSPPDRLPTNHYMNYNGNTLEDMKECRTDDTTLVFFCHLGVMMVLMSHLLHISFCALTHGFFVAPSSVTVLASEERIPGSAFFRAQVVGDTSHLSAANEPVSYYGYFTSPFQG